MDILLLVLELQSPAEWRTLCLVNRQFRAIAERLLYSKIQWSWRNHENPPPIVPFLWTIISRPELAAHIRKIQLEGRYLSNYGSSSSIASIPVSGAALDKGIEFIQRTGVPYSDFWIQQLRKSVLDALMALLLAQLPNLRQLDLGPVFLQRSTLIGMVLSSAVCEPGVYQLPDFPHLMDVSVLSRFGWDRAREKEKIQNTPDFLPLFYLPNLERMSVSIRSSTTFKWPIACLPDPSRLKSLELSSIREAHLIDILSVTKSLEKLSWMWYYDFGLSYGVDGLFNQPIVNLDQIGSALSQIPPSLKELNISAEVGMGGNDSWYPGVSIKGSLHQLADLDHVKRLKIPLAFLVGFAQDTSKTLQDKMPKNLEFLTLTYDLGIQEDPEMPEFDWEDWAVLGLLQSWLGVWESCTPRLRGITLVVELLLEWIGAWDSDMMCQLSELSIQTGIQLDVIRK